MVDVTEGVAKKSPHLLYVLTHYEPFFVQQKQCYGINLQCILN